MTDRPSPRRKKVPDHVKVDVLLIALGLKGKTINWSHEPALELRAINEAYTDWDPPQHDPRFIFARTKDEHDVLTNVNNGTGRSDKGAIAHVRHLTEDHEEFRRKILARPCGEKREKRGTILGRGFQKRANAKVRS